VVVIASIYSRDLAPSDASYDHQIIGIVRIPEFTWLPTDIDLGTLLGTVICLPEDYAFAITEFLDMLCTASEAISAVIFGFPVRPDPHDFPFIEGTHMITAYTTSDELGFVSLTHSDACTG